MASNVPDSQSGTMALLGGAEVAKYPGGLGPKARFAEFVFSGRRRRGIREKAGRKKRSRFKVCASGWLAQSGSCATCSWSRALLHLLTCKYIVNLSLS